MEIAEEKKVVAILVTQTSNKAADSGLAPVGLDGLTAHKLPLAFVRRDEILLSIDALFHSNP